MLKISNFKIIYLGRFVEMFRNYVFIKQNNNNLGILIIIKIIHFKYIYWNGITICNL